MKPKNLMDVVLGGAFAVLGIGVIVGSQNLTSISGLPVGPGLFPTVTGAAMLIFGIVLVGQGWLAPAGELIGVPDEVAELAEDPNPPKRSWLDFWFIPLLLIAVAATIPLIPALGFLIAGTIFTAVIVVLCGGCSCAPSSSARSRRSSSTRSSSTGCACRCRVDCWGKSWTLSCKQWAWSSPGKPWPPSYCRPFSAFSSAPCPA